MIAKATAKAAGMIYYGTIDGNRTLRHEEKAKISLCMPALVAQLDASSNWRPGGRGFNPAEVSNILSWRLIMKYFLRSFSPFH